MTTTLPQNGPDHQKPLEPIVVVDEAAIDTEVECPALTDAVVAEIIRRGASYQENPEAAIAWELLKAQLSSEPQQ